MKTNCTLNNQCVVIQFNSKFCVLRFNFPNSPVLKMSDTTSSTTISHHHTARPNAMDKAFEVFLEAYRRKHLQWDLSKVVARGANAWKELPLRKREKFIRSPTKRSLKHHHDATHDRKKKRVADPTESDESVEVKKAKVGRKRSQSLVQITCNECKRKMRKLQKPSGSEIDSSEEEKEEEDEVSDTTSTESVKEDQHLKKATGHQKKVAWKIQHKSKKNKKSKKTYSDIIKTLDLDQFDVD